MADEKNNQAKKKTPTADTNSFKTVSEASTTSPAASASLSGSSDTGTSTAKSAGQMTDDAADAAKDEASGLADKAKAEAAKFGNQARHAAEDRVESYKSQATSRIDETADHIRNAGHEFGDDSYQAQAADYLASNLSQAADMIRNQDLGSIADDVSGFARRNPALFLGGAALIGFALARLMKASDSSDDFDRPVSGVSGTRYGRPEAGAGVRGGYRP